MASEKVPRSPSEGQRLAQLETKGERSDCHWGGGGRASTPRSHLGTAGKFGFYPVTGGGSFAYSHWKQGRRFALYMNILEYYQVVEMKSLEEM